MNLLINNAVDINLDTGEEKRVAVRVDNGRVSSIIDSLPAGALKEADRISLDAQGAYLLPGLIDFHTHLFTRGSGFGMNGDLLISSGVTMAVDMGTAGCAGYEAFRMTDILPRTIRIKSFLNLSPAGQPGAGISEPLCRSAVKEEQMEKLIQKYGDEIRGIKVRISRSIVGEEGISPLNHALELAERFQLPVCVHTTDPPVNAEEIVKRLRPGDIYSHMYHNKGMTILRQDKTIYKSFYEAQKRGVFLEVGNGKMNFHFDVAKRAMEEGLFPDIISSDATSTTYESSGAMKDLAFVMSKFLNMGMPTHRVFAAVTREPARCLGIDGSAGTLKEGGIADLTLARICERETVFSDSDGNIRRGTKILTPEMTMIGGRIVYLQKRK